MLTVSHFDCFNPTAARPLPSHLYLCVQLASQRHLTSRVTHHNFIRYVHVFCVFFAAVAEEDERLPESEFIVDVGLRAQLTDAGTAAVAAARAAAQRAAVAPEVSLYRALLCSQHGFQLCLYCVLCVSFRCCPALCPCGVLAWVLGG